MCTKKNLHQRLYQRTLQLIQAASLQLPGFGKDCLAMTFPGKRKTGQEPPNSGE